MSGISEEEKNRRILFSRQLGIVRPERLKDLPITIIGAGGIGSPTALLLAKMGCENITVYDFDEVEDVNLPNQLHPHDSVGKAKVDAVRDMVKYMTGVEINGVEDRFMGEDWEGGILITAVDNMFSRNVIWDNVKDHEGLDLLIDGRMGGRTLSVLTLNPNHEDYEEHLKEYEDEWLFDDEDAAPMPCTQKAIIFNTAGIASHIASQIVDYVNESDTSFEVTYDYVTKHSVG